MSLVSVVRCQVEVYASGRSLVQRSSTWCGVSECDREAASVRRPWSARGCRAMKKEVLYAFCMVLGTKVIDYFPVQL